MKSEESELQSNRQDYLRSVKLLKHDYSELEREVERHRHNETILNQLHEEGVIDEGGNLLIMKK